MKPLDEQIVDSVLSEHIGRLEALIRDAFQKHFGFDIMEVKDRENLRRVVIEGDDIERFQYREETFFIWQNRSLDFKVEQKKDCFEVTLTTKVAQV